MVRTEDVSYPSDLNFTKEKLIESIKTKIRKARTTQSTPHKDSLLPKINHDKLDKDLKQRSIASFNSMFQ